ncbi:hypothetical protein [Aliarcobacter butzleri]|uniref:hypothetical protein n=1 Tax=Aliarcobacter butzleri TaxID=28197 RepID=UPI0021B2357D|nr:hypothetical protein [Aliarcobacter butzleri]MCT7576462.1 hypothetical protein [Aliarcobacter butzleri]MDN5053834.1 hypothetical protein [Aliarcobacter butzleri]
MGKLIKIDDISKELEAVPFLDAPEGYWNQSKDGFNGFEQIAISDMSERHITNSINMIKNQYIPNYRKKEYILKLLEKKIEELEEEL